MPFRRPPADPDPAVRARLLALLGLASPADVAPPDVSEPAAGLVGAMGERLPATVRGGRLDPGRCGVAGLAVVALLALVVTGVVVWRGRPRAVDVAAPVVAAGSPSAALLVVDVAGDVRRPGLVRLSPGARVADAIAAAGGLRSGASYGTLNLARKLVDGEQVYVGALPPGGSDGGGGTAAGAHSPGGLVDLNTATADELDALPGIGPVLADRIVAWRTAHGGFRSVDELRQVEGIGARKFDSVKSLLTV